MKRLLVLGVLIGTPQAHLALAIGFLVLICGVVVVVAGTLFCKDDAPARRLSRLIRAIRQSAHR